MNKRFFLNFDWGLLAPVLVLVALSLTVLFSINFSIFRSQFIFFIVGIIAFLFFSSINYRAVSLYAVPMYVISIALLVIVLVVGIESRGSIRWFEFFGFRIQFSEIFKPFLAISLSSYLFEKDNHSPKTFFLTLGFLLPVAFLIFMQPDLGNAIIYFLVVILTLIIFGFPLRYFFGILIFILLSLPLFWKFLHNYQKQRIFTFLNPTDPLGLSYNAVQSVIAVGSGLLFGKGLGLGTQSELRFLPEFHTDFIFATISEEFGLIGAFIMILAFAFLMYRIFVIFFNQDDMLCKIFAIIAFSIIFFQFFINVGMNLGLLPIVGITLPFVSYGGSSLLSNFILLGILSSISKRRLAQDVLEIK